MIDAVLSYHMNPQTCGVAKFNHRLAKELGVPCERAVDTLKYAGTRNKVLVSLKGSELPRDLCSYLPRFTRFDLFLHDRPQLPELPNATRVFYADEIGCPSTVDGDPTRGAYRVLTFGMAHKRLLHHYEVLKTQLDQEQKAGYTVEMSTAIHEGTPWDEGHQRSIDNMRAIFGDKLRVLGFLGDDALAKELSDVDAVAVYFDPAFRANNTSAWAAIDAGKTLFTNRDEHSPKIGERRTWKQLTDLLCAP